MVFKNLKGNFPRENTRKSLDILILAVERLIETKISLSEATNPHFISNELFKQITMELGFDPTHKVIF